MKKLFLLMSAGVFIFLGTAHAVMIEIDSLDQEWTDTGVDIDIGDWINITAGDSVNNGNRDVTPDGYDVTRNGFFNLTPWSLIGKIGDNEPFLVGSFFDEKSNDAGRLYLLFNDNYYRDNEGIWTADIDINPVPEPMTLLLLGSGLIGLAGLRKKLKKI